MALIDRVFHDDPDEERHLPNHAFSAAIWFWAQGKITRAQVVTAFDITTDDEIQLDLLKAHHDGMTAEEQRKFHSDVESAGVLAETGLITKQQYSMLLGLT